MSSLWSKRRNVFSRSEYDFRRLIDHRRRFHVKDSPDARDQFVCDIDKTYLETNFESVIQMMRVAFEEAREKVTVSGASEVLLAARWGGPQVPDKEKHLYPRPLHFVSSSPPQLRSTLEEKLTLDGLDWTSDTFKNQAYNIRKGRMDLLRQQVAYKSAAILKLMQEAEPGTRFFLLGDNAEHDAFIYLGLRLFLEHRLSAAAYRTYLEAAGVESKVAMDFTDLLKSIPEVSIAGILIRKAPGYQFVDHPPLTDSIQLFNNFYEAALILMGLKVITPTNLWPLTRAFHNRHGLSRDEISACLSTMVNSESISEELKEAIRMTEAELLKAGPIGATESKQGLHLAQADMTEFRKLSEADILAAARDWAAKLPS